MWIFILGSPQNPPLFFSSKSAKHFYYCYLVLTLSIKTNTRSTDLQVHQSQLLFLLIVSILWIKDSNQLTKSNLIVEGFESHLLSLEVSEYILDEINNQVSWYLCCQHET